MRGSASKRLEESLYRSGGTIKKRRVWLEKLFQELDQKEYNSISIYYWPWGTPGFNITLETKAGDRVKINIIKKRIMDYTVSNGRTQIGGYTKRIQDILNVMK